MNEVTIGSVHVRHLQGSCQVMKQLKGVRANGSHQNKDSANERTARDVTKLPRIGGLEVTHSKIDSGIKHLTPRPHVASSVRRAIVQYDTYISQVHDSHLCNDAPVTAAAYHVLSSHTYFQNIVCSRREKTQHWLRWRRLRTQRRLRTRLMCTTHARSPLSSLKSRSGLYRWASPRANTTNSCLHIEKWLRWVHFSINAFGGRVF